jgi:uncharacterized protein YndB with AHSA1/START domain
MPDILHEVTIQGSPEKVYDALTHQEGLESWWTTNAKAEPKEGTILEFQFHNPDAMFKMEVAKLEPGKKVYWNVLQGAPDWGGTHVTWDLEAVGGGTKVLFGHRDYASYGGSFASVSYSWAWFLTSLKMYIETGQGTPAS